ncbi:uncharacterized protein L969DRAFT_84527 [Mixia osmundae IAM 14324]|uniref:Uncharacterized protein n=1 Tax=Mixia osmundae (strain CBS 9802 / IAM 14324 / JCM 22182 / KY 12970) TaxID=764103 RepID=G7E578_MIXOS|nr:uncharacterized protein L969DRAFT_84527 [Mixia osmundae IAM 14324]KEI42655.1 hypothetical protein L969DRAFT_84527 [Mixia osmundae IAM 14324]GAA97988.1 hypothetical protein E5Q_04668 [Mixia osmundae IAM 14324]
MATGLFPPSVDQKRADTLGIKDRLASLLPPDQGLVYWTSLVDFLTGKLSRDEFEEATQSALRRGGPEAAELHTALILSVLFNTSRSSATPSSRHSGWSKRRRLEGDDLLERDSQRARLRNQVMSLGKRERARLKQLNTIDLAQSANAASKAKVNGTLPAASPTSPTRLGADGQALLAKPRVEIVKPGSAKAKEGPVFPNAEVSTQDYNRWQQAPLCLESKRLPDHESLTDRMSLIACDSGLSAGVDKPAVSLMLLAVERHIRTLLTSALDVVRPSRHQEAAVLLPDEVPKTAAELVRGLSPEPATSHSLALRDLATLFEISPSTTVQSHMGAIERPLALLDTTAMPADHVSK